MGIAIFNKLFSVTENKSEERRKRVASSSVAMLLNLRFILIIFSHLQLVATKKSSRHGRFNLQIEFIYYFRLCILRSMSTGLLKVVVIKSKRPIHHRLREIFTSISINDENELDTYPMDFQWFGVLQ